MIWLICELNGIGYRYTSCESMESAEYLNFELWNYRNKFGQRNEDYFETFLLLNSYKRYKIRYNKISSFGNLDGRFTTFIFSQKKFNRFSGDFIKKIVKQSIIIDFIFCDFYEQKNVLFKGEQIVITRGKILGKRFNMYSYETK